MGAVPIDPELLASMAAGFIGFVGGSFVGLLVHECGHAFAGSAVGLQPRAVVVGTGPLLWRHRFRRTWFVLHAWPTYGFAARLSDPAGRRSAQALVVAAGPVASLLLCAGASMGVVAAFGSKSVVVSEMCLGLAGASGMHFLTAMWPRTFKIKGRPGVHVTDGLKLVRLARGEDIDQFNARYRKLLRSVLDEREASDPPSIFAPELLYQLSRTDKRERWAREDMASVVAHLLHEPALSEAERQFLVKRYQLDPLEDTPG